MLWQMTLCMSHDSTQFFPDQELSDDSNHESLLISQESIRSDVFPLGRCLCVSYLGDAIFGG